MKRIITLLITCLIPLFVLAQEREEKRLELKNGSVLTGFVEVQQDGSYMLETASGDVFFFSPSEVSKVVLLKSKPKDKEKRSGRIYRSGGELRFIDTGELLTQDDFLNYQGWEKYQKAQKMRKTGHNIMLWGSLGCIAAGLLVGGVLWPNTGDVGMLWAPAVIGGMAAVAPFTTGLILKSSGNSKLNKMVNSYNQRPGYVLNFGAQQYGIGFAFNF